ncbi:MAG: aspartate dehydrogenase [Candidatus Omnitrophica bacterium]|nr:aspartate dehydrogenase [Candidatus Omnitrophota bacterium]
MIRIGIIGCGNIGSVLAKTIRKKFSRFARLAYVSDINPAQIERLRKKIKSASFRSVSISELIKKSDFVIETASVKAAEEVIPQVLEQGKDVLILSVGGILKVKNLDRLLAKSCGRIYVPSGGIAGVDAVLAARMGQIKRVQITTRKPLRSLANAPYFLKNGLRPERIKKPTLIFQGNAAEAIENFPENVNVAVTLSLAGVGPRKTHVRVFASPTYRHNMHEIQIEGSFGRMVSQVMNLPSRENPKTSALAIGSAIAILEKIFKRIKIGT